jgi:hypothetical protein
LSQKCNLGEMVSNIVLGEWNMLWGMRSMNV